MSKPPAGPERPTVIERVVMVFHLPYFWGSLVLLPLVGDTAVFWLSYLNTFSVDKALATTMEVLTITAILPPWQQVLLIIDHSVLVPLYCLYMIRYVRNRVIATGQSLAPLAEGGEETFRRSFRFVSLPWPPVMISAAPVAFLSILAGQPGFTLVQGPIIVGAALAYFVNFFIVFTLIWVYFASISGIHSFAKSLRLRPYYEDSTLGMKPIGSLSLLLVASVLGLFAIAFPTASFQSPLVSYGFGLSVVIFGVLLFFLPLNRIHGMMQEAKIRERKLIHSQLKDFLLPPGDSSREDQQSALLQQVRLQLRLSTLQTARQEVDKMPTWPFDLGVLARLSAIAITVAAITLARVLQLALHLAT